MIAEQEYTEPPFLTVPVTFPRATVGQRILNGVIDFLALYVILMLVSFILLVTAQVRVITGGYFSSLLLFLLLLLALLYYPLWEGVTKGRSVGKLITRTKAVRADGRDISWKDAVLRMLCRLIPFEPFSVLATRPWHDRFSDTQVVQLRKK